MLEAFGATEAPEPIGGGQGQNFEAGDLIFKPAIDDAETNWLGRFYESIWSENFRLPKPIRTTEGTLVFEGWQAWEKLDGQHVRGRWLDTIDVCVDFHAAIADQPIPEYFEQRDQNPIRRRRCRNWADQPVALWADRGHPG